MSVTGWPSESKGTAVATSGWLAVGLAGVRLTRTEAGLPATTVEAETAAPCWVELSGKVAIGVTATVIGRRAADVEPSVSASVVSGRCLLGTRAG